MTKQITSRHMSGHLLLTFFEGPHGRDEGWSLTFVPTDTTTTLSAEDVRGFLVARAMAGDGPYDADQARQVFNATARLAHWVEGRAAPADDTPQVA